MTDSQSYINPFLGTLPDGPSRAASIQALQAWTKAQRKLLESGETFMKGWFDRNRAAADANADAVQRLSTCKDPSEAAKIWTDLASSHTDRTTAAATAYYEQCMTMWTQMAEAARSACDVEGVAREAMPQAPDDRKSVNVRRAAS